MPATEPMSRGSPAAWRFAGFWLVVVAVLLTILGVVLALHQAQSLTILLHAQAQRRAADIAVTARALFEAQLDDILISACDSSAGGGWEHALPPRALPGWLGGVFGVKGGTLTPLLTGPQASAAQAEQLKRLCFGGAPPELLETTSRGAEVLTDLSGSAPVVMVRLACIEEPGRFAAVVALADVERLRRELVEPLLSPLDGLELAPAGANYRPWSQALLGAGRFWVLKPAEALLSDPRYTVVGQTLAYLGVTTLALLTLLAAMWARSRVARREMALAELKANFVADVSHELKTPLAVIRLYAETLQSGRVGADEKRQEYYGIITRECTRLTNLINNILDFARIDAGRKEYTFAPTDVGQVVRETYAAYRGELDRHRFEHRVSIEEELPAVDADKDAIAQVLFNLMNNAVKYSDDDRSLAIEVTRDTRRDRHGVLISVHDRGIGIRPEDRAHLFEGFFRADDSRVRERGGTGLGLALVKNIVDAHGGSIDVESRLVKGSTFRVFLPSAASR
ncbi:MAG: hypothetical protein HY763_04655 [Planctomycetes bacterium]|nr:hypothetical protein [Planctomycetota bacterium]